MAADLMLSRELKALQDELAASQQERATPTTAESAARAGASPAPNAPRAAPRTTSCAISCESSRAEEFVAGGAWVSTVVLAETVWALVSVYDLKPAAIALVVRGFLDNANLALQDADAVTAAVERFERRPPLAFSDCLVLEVARKAGHLSLGTFDRPLAKLDGAKAL